MDESSHNPSRELALVSLLTDCQAGLRMYVRTLMVGEQAVSDVIQHANMKIWEKRQDFELGTNFRAWAFAIARFEVLNYRKQQARDARLQFSDELEATLAAEIAELEEEELPHQEALRVCLKSLSAKHQELLLHRYASGGTLAEFAERAGRSVAGLKVTLHRLRQSLADCIDRRILRVGESE
ncbi:sigma-70 family RNA polymerase sigma factor [Aureliella helgolandensis]|uniref:RNA polymerase sigma factor n=1 Tax=Aureliella helgolandensis TaxID=2527968 RepID=A0A518G8E5_9BACT|nr:sigma-70 family RNA polymerase sigma factor [Aureliella helgolandensis]QDV24854.1 RNA polymerase sigma factor [Aureliella helgolandensis]